MKLKKVKNILRAIESMLFLECWLMFIFALLIVLFDGLDKGLFIEVQSVSGNVLKASIALIVIVQTQVFSVHDLFNKCNEKRLEEYKNLTNDD